MFKRNIKITKDYFSLVKFKNKYLITFIIVDLINVLISLFVPYFISLIVENVTNGLFDKSFIFVILLGVTYLFNKIGSYYTLRNCRNAILNGYFVGNGNTLLDVEVWSQIEFTEV